MPSSKEIADAVRKWQGGWEAANEIERISTEEVKEAFYAGYKASGKAYYDYEIDTAWERHNA